MTPVETAALTALRESISSIVESDEVNKTELAVESLAQYRAYLGADDTAVIKRTPRFPFDNATKKDNTTMPTTIDTIDPPMALAMVTEYAKLVAMRNRVPLSKGYEVARNELVTKDGVLVFDIAKQATGYHNSDGAAQRLQTADVIYPKARNEDHSGATTYYAPWNVQTGSDELTRLRQQEAHLALRDHNAAVAKFKAAGAKDPHGAARTEDPTRWEKALKARGHPPMQPFAIRP